MKTGFYKLTRDVKNPNVDRRATRTFSKSEVWETGTVVAVAPWVDSFEGKSLQIWVPGDYQHNGLIGVPGHTPDADDRRAQAFAALTAPGVLEPLPESLDSVLMLECDFGPHSTVPNHILQKLVDTGRVSLDDVRTAYAALREDWAREDEANRATKKEEG